MRSTVLALLAALAFASAAVPQLGVVPSKQRTAAVRSPLAVVIPGDSLAEAVLVDGSVNFLSIYGGVLTLRIRARLPPEHTGQRTRHSKSPAPAPHTRSAHPLRTPTPHTHSARARSSLSNLGYDWFSSDSASSQHLPPPQSSRGSRKRRASSFSVPSSPSQTST